MVDIPGGLGANKGYWLKQMRDRYGKFLEELGEVLFEVELDGVQGTQHATGIFIGAVDPSTIRIEVPDSSRIPKGVYVVKTDRVTAIKAIIPQEHLDKKSGAPESLKPSMTGSEVLKTRLKSVTKLLKEQGRFPMPRISSMASAGKDTDIANGARVDYKKAYDASPELREAFPTFDESWDYVARLGTDLTTQSPNELKDIPKEMKLLNREYAKHVLGLDPDGLITIYRNAVNGKSSEQDSAVGYASLDRDMAYDYASTRENIEANGRYEIDVKPDEVYGMLGYSQVEDEYGLTIGKEVAYTPDRVRRVGDLAPAEFPSWLQEWNSTFKRGQGNSPLRAFGISSQYDFHEVEDFLGSNLQEFLGRHNLQASDIAAKFDELYGEGSYATYKESGNTVNFANIQKLFVRLDNGNLGLNVEYLEEFNGLNSTNSYKNDGLDNRLKMLSLFQELTGTYFMTHKTRDYTPPSIESEPRDTTGDDATADSLPEQPDNQTGIFKDYSPDNSSNAAEDTPLTDLGFDPEQEITVYRGVPSGAGGGISSGDWVTTLPQLAKDYAGGGKVVSMKVKAKDLLTDPSSGEDAYTEEMVYRPSKESTNEVSEPTEADNTDIVAPGIENWLPVMADILGLDDDEESGDDANPASGNELLSKTLKKAGYNEKPKTVSAEEFNSIEGETIYRAVSEERFIDQYLNSSDHFAGTGVFGNGTYSTSKKESAEAYAGSTDGDADVLNARLLEMKLSPDAKVLSFNSKRDLRKWADENASKFKEAYKKSGASREEVDAFEWKINNASDWTNLAVMAGFDAIRFPPDAITEHFTIILNRGKVIVNDKS